jgi:Leucine Rich repeat
MYHVHDDYDDPPVSPCMSVLLILCRPFRTLERLWLDGNNIGVKGAMAMAEALKHNSSLQELNLSCNNHISDALHTQIKTLLTEEKSDKRCLELE